MLLETLNILEGTDLKAMGPNSADYIHTVHEAIKLAYDDRNAYLGDPAFATVPLKGLLSKPEVAAPCHAKHRATGRNPRETPAPASFSPQRFPPRRPVLCGGRIPLLRAALTG